MWKGSESDGTRRPDLMKMSVYSCASLTQKRPASWWNACLPVHRRRRAKARGTRAEGRHGCESLGLNREDFCVGCEGKRGCKRPRAEAAMPVPPAGPPTAPSLLPCENKAVDRYSDDRRYEMKVHNHRIDSNEAFGRMQHRKRTKLPEWGSVTGCLQKSTMGPMDAWLAKDSVERAVTQAAQSRFDRWPRRTHSSTASCRKSGWSGHILKEIAKCRV